MRSSVNNFNTAFGRTIVCVDYLAPGPYDVNMAVSLESL